MTTEPQEPDGGTVHRCFAIFAGAAERLLATGQVTRGDVAAALFASFMNEAQNIHGADALAAWLRDAADEIELRLDHPDGPGDRRRLQ